MTVKVVNTTEDIPDEMVEGKPTLVYWNIAGLAMPIRLALVHAGVDFADIRIQSDLPNVPNRNKMWHDAKNGKIANIIPFPNLPYFLDGDVHVSQTNTILRHIARKYKMVPEKAHLSDLCCDHLTDIETAIMRRVYSEGPEAMFQWFQTEVPGILAQFSELLKSGGTPFLTGSQPMIDDFKFYTFCHKMKVVQEQLGNETTKGIITDDIVAYMKRIEQLPRVKEYLVSSDHLAKPINNVSAKWVGA